jgi:hypothetical protein
MLAACGPAYDRSASGGPHCADHGAGLTKACLLLAPRRQQRADRGIEPSPTSAERPELDIHGKAAEMPRETQLHGDGFSVEVIAASAGSSRSRAVHFSFLTGSRLGDAALAFGDKIAMMAPYCRRLPLGRNSGVGESRVGSHGSLPPRVSRRLWLTPSCWARGGDDPPSCATQVRRRVRRQRGQLHGRAAPGRSHAAARVRSVTALLLGRAVLVAGPWRRRWHSRSMSAGVVEWRPTVTAAGR